MRTGWKKGDKLRVLPPAPFEGQIGTLLKDAEGPDDPLRVRLNPHSGGWIEIDGTPDKFEKFAYDPTPLKYVNPGYVTPESWVAPQNHHQTEANMELPPSDAPEPLLSNDLTLTVTKPDGLIEQLTVPEAIVNELILSIRSGSFLVVNARLEDGDVAIRYTVQNFPREKLGKTLMLLGAEMARM